MADGRKRESWGKEKTETEQSISGPWELPSCFSGRPWSIDAPTRPITAAAEAWETGHSKLGPRLD